MFYRVTQGSNLGTLTVCCSRWLTFAQFGHGLMFPYVSIFALHFSRFMCFTHYIWRWLLCSAKPLFGYKRDLLTATFIIFEYPLIARTKIRKRKKRDELYFCGAPQGSHLGRFLTNLYVLYRCFEEELNICNAPQGSSLIISEILVSVK